MKRFYLLFSILFFCLNLYSHPWKPSHYVIIDTDGGIDDIKAITMLLASPDVRVLAITTSSGALSAENAYIKVRSLLNSYFHEGIPVGINRISSVNFAEFQVALETKWGNEDGINAREAPDFIPVISEIISAEKTKISFICLGSMSTALNALRTIPELGKQVKDFIWSADGPDDKAGFNYNIDKKSSVAMLKQEIPVKIVRNFTIIDNDFYDDELLNSLGYVKTVYAKKLSAFFNSDAAKNHKFSFVAADEMTVIFLHYPELFINKTLGNISDCIPSDLPGLRESAIRILKGETVPKNQVLKEFPDDPSFYFDDIKGSVTDIIDKYGMDEWSSGVLANELHRHLGVFAIIGVKMGIRAREYFDTGVDEFRATSFAGSVPPLSCFNDGLQVSTGATPGHGLLTVVNDPPASPSAEFTYMGWKIRLTLKSGITEKITSELKEINFVYGLDSNTYWELVRKNSIKYWLNLDRHEIFEIEEVVHPLPSPAPGESGGGLK
jgi:pyrimidine-specific ribonucleoside hydrolase